MHRCKYCNNTFGRHNNLLKHQKTARYCLILQGKLTEAKQATYKRTYTCKYCSNQFSRSDNLKRHIPTCPENIAMHEDKARSQDKQLLEMIIQLQRTIANMSEHTSGTTNNRNMTMNLAPITDEEIQEHLEHLTIDFIQEGAKGYANYANSYPFKDRVLCTDKARKKLRYKDNTGEMVDDASGVKLAKRFFQAIAPRNEEIINAEYAALHQEVQQIAQDGTAYRTDLTGLLTKASHLQELLIKCQQAARGEENELTKEFVSHLSKML